MATAQTLIDEALRELGVIASGAAGNATESAEALIKLNRMIETWNTNGAIVFQKKRTTHTLTPSLSPHTIGSGGTFNTDRPVFIYGAGLIVSGGSEEVPLEVIRTIEDYQLIPNKTQTGSPTRLWYDAAYATARGNLYLHPVPSAADTLVLYRPAPLESLAALTTTVAFPPGYEECLLYNLAQRLAPSYGATPSKSIVTMARKCYAWLESVNSAPPSVATADFGVPRGMGARDYRTGI